MGFFYAEHGLTFIHSVQSKKLPLDVIVAGPATAKPTVQQRPKVSTKTLPVGPLLKTTSSGKVPQQSIAS